MKNRYEELFDCFLAEIEMELVKYSDGWGLRDLQNGNLNNIENERFEDAMQIFDKTDRYIEDYFVFPIKEKFLLNDEEDITWSEIATRYKGKKGNSEEDEYELEILDMICNHPDKVDLENCLFTDASQNVFTVVFQTGEDEDAFISFSSINLATEYVSKEADEEEKTLRKCGYKTRRIESGMSTVVYVPDSSISYEWKIEENKLVSRNYAKNKENSYNRRRIK